MILIGSALAGMVLVYVGGMQYLAWYFRWETRQTDGLAYFGKPIADRRALKRRIRRLSRPVVPLVRLLAATNRKALTMPVFEYAGVCGPPKVSSVERFERASKYQPRPEDVFVATQMRCGTTWMQQLVLEIVTRGRADLSDRGFGHLYAISPWIEAAHTISIEDAPLVGDRPTRIIKTHLPASLCPYSRDAKYIYVTRHPVGCFASIVDYNRTLLGPLMPPLEALTDWYCSDRMYWSPWPKHVDGWWRWAQTRPNVLFVHFEQMAQQFDRVRDDVARFLGYTLTDEERQRISGKCTFRYMKEHEEFFEMAAPTMFSVDGGEYLKSGKAARDGDVPGKIRDRILHYCRSALKDQRYPAARFYADLADG